MKKVKQVSAATMKSSDIMDHISAPHLPKGHHSNTGNWFQLKRIIKFDLRDLEDTPKN